MNLKPNITIGTTDAVGVRIVIIGISHLGA